METVRQAQGKESEQITAGYLKKRGFVIIEQNYESPLGEIDIIAKKKGVVHIVEVKSGASGSPFFRPEYNLHSPQRRRLLRSARMYLLRKHYPPGQEWQIDLITVELRYGQEPVIQHYERAITE
jgi:putative endonuclease